jgi:SNF2 family DNA or RNA helicase
VNWEEIVEDAAWESGSREVGTVTIGNKEVVGIGHAQSKHPPLIPLLRRQRTHAHNLSSSVYDPHPRLGEGRLVRSTDDRVSALLYSYRDYRDEDGDGWDWDCFDPKLQSSQEASGVRGEKKRKASGSHIDWNERNPQRAGTQDAERKQETTIPLAVQVIRQETQAGEQSLNRRILVVSRFLPLLDELGKALQPLDCILSRYDKTMSEEARANSLKSFRQDANSPQALLMTTSCSHEQVDLSCVTTIIFLTPHGNPYVEQRCIELVTTKKQPEDRVTALWLLRDNSVERQIVKTRDERERQSMALNQPLNTIDPSLFQETSRFSFDDVRRLVSG